MNWDGLKPRSYFFFGAALGAWLNIWPPLLDPRAGFVFAYALVFYSLFSAERDCN